MCHGDSHSNKFVTQIINSIIYPSTTQKTIKIALAITFEVNIQTYKKHKPLAPRHIKLIGLPVADRLHPGEQIQPL